MNIKRSTLALSRQEYEYTIPLAEAEEMLAALCDGRVVEKTRHIIEHAGVTWEIDEFEGANQGLIVAEVELESEEQEIVLPDWVGVEVSGQARYMNSNLALEPFTTWAL